MDGKTARTIHKALYDATIKSKPQYADKVLLGMAVKLANKAKKLPSSDGLAVAIFDLFKKQKSNHLANKIINYDTQKIAEKKKDDLWDQFVEQNRDRGRWFYLASSHNDCAIDHKPYQGKMYVDNKAPEEAIQYAKSKGWKTVQWVTGEPAWFITRPNCRHYFVSLRLDEVMGKSIRKLQRKHRTHTREGDRQFQTPAHAAVEEYRDRLEMLRKLYAEHPTEELKKEMLKARMLLKKWEGQL